jgi:transcriptional regulator with XRE-family HTH domain
MEFRPMTEIPDKVLQRAIGEELRIAREQRGWSRIQLISRIPSGIGDRTLLSYEHGTRSIQMLRFAELCHALGISMAGLLTMALQRAQIYLENERLLVDLPALIDGENPTFRPLIQWARNKLVRQTTRVASLSPAAVDELADVVGCDRRDLAIYLARFIPDHHELVDEAPQDITVTERVFRATTR